jgi:hypothetical protein
MKPSFLKQPPGIPDRQTARGCCAANLAMPGSGSVAGGRRIGYVQMALGLTGLGASLWSGARFILWGLKNLPRFYDPATDPLAALQDLWRAARWPFLGLGIFAAAWFWALGTSLSLLRRAKAGGPTAVDGIPPRLTDGSGPLSKPL